MDALVSRSPSLTGRLPPLRQRFAAFALWSIPAGLAFFSIYPATNWLAWQDRHHFQLFLASELHIPFIPGFIWPYLSMYILFFIPPFFLSQAELRRLAIQLVAATFIAGVVFMLFPAKLGFTRVLPSDDLYRWLFNVLYYVDLPFNLAPSLHVVYSTVIFLALASSVGKIVRLAVFLWLVLIVLSTVLVHQHHLLDVVSGVMLAVSMRFLWERKND